MDQNNGLTQMRLLYTIIQYQKLRYNGAVLRARIIGFKDKT